MVDFMTASGIAPLMAMMGAFFIVFVIVLIALYIYMAIALMTIADKKRVANSWLAFIPIANLYLMTQIARVSPWWTAAVLLAFIPLVGGLILAGVSIYLYWMIAEELGKPGWWGVLMIIPIVNFVIIGVMAWGN